MNNETSLQLRPVPAGLFDSPEVEQLPAGDSQLGVLEAFEQLRELREEMEAGSLPIGEYKAKQRGILRRIK